MQPKDLLKRYGRVNTGWASRFDSDRSQNSSQMLCPLPQQRTLDGRDANVNTQNMKTSGCFSPLDIMQTENVQRPIYSSNASIGLLTPENDLGVVNRAIHYDMNSNYTLNDTKALYNMASRNMQWNYISRKVQYFKNLSGMSG